MRDLAVESAGSSRRRTVVGLVVTALGGAALLNGLFGKSGNKPASVGFGATVIFFGVAVLGPVFARPASRLLGAPLPACAASPAPSPARMRCATPSAPPPPRPR